MSEIFSKDIYAYVSDEKENFETGIGVMITGDWYWNMFRHCERTLLMKNSHFPVHDSDVFNPKNARPYKNIILPIINVAHRTEGFDVKDIEPFVNSESDYHLSLLVRKFNRKWARQNDLDTFIDEVVEGLDYGFVLVKNVNNVRPEVVQPQQIAFCDQTDILSGTIALRHIYSIDQLKEVGKELKWYPDVIDMAIRNAKSTKKVPNESKQSRIPQKSIEVFEVHGTFPEEWLVKDSPDAESYNSTLSADDYCKQLHIITYLTDENGTKKGVCLFKGRETKEVFKLLIVNPIYGRAAGRGRVEELFEPQIWTNFSEIHMFNMLKEASKVIQVTTDPKFTTRNNTKNTTGGEVFNIERGETIQQLNTTPVNINLFDRAVTEWEQHAREVGSASDPQLGIKPASGTPLGTTQIVTAQGQGIHDYRRGKIATFIGEIYRDWILQYLIADMNKGNEWVDELTLEEMNMVVDNLIECDFEDYLKKLVLAGQEIPQQQQLEQMKQQYRQQFFKHGGKRFFKIAKDEFNEIPIEVEINIAGKQKDLAGLTEKLSNVFRTIISNPRILQIPYVAKLFNKILESSGLDQIDFTSSAPLPQMFQIRETINYKDLDPEGQKNMAANAGIQTNPQENQAPNLPTNALEGIGAGR